MKINVLKHTAPLFAALLLAASLSLPLAGCALPQDRAVTETPAEEPAADAAPASEEAPEAEAGEEIPLLDLNERTAAPGRAAWSADRLTITAGGAYRLSGSLEGRVTVDADGPVTLIFEGAALTGESCLDICSGDVVTLEAAPGTANLLADVPPASGEASGGASSAGPSGEAEDDGNAQDAEEPEAGEVEDASGAVVTSKAPLVFTGEGSITVTAAVNNGIRCKDDLTVESGTLAVTAANKAIRANGSLTVEGGVLTAEAGGSALSASAGRITPGAVSIRGGSVTLASEGRGIDAEDLALVSGGELVITSGDDGIRADTVSIAGGHLTIAAGCDGIQAGTLLTVEDGEISVTTGEGGGNAISHPGESFGPWGQSSATEDDASRKGLKSGGGVTITGGAITLNTEDDAIHCGTLCTVDGGQIDIISNDDGIHSDDMLVINGGAVNLRDCFEGLEAFAVEIRGGDVYIRSVNDGINANGMEMMFRRNDTQTESEPVSASGATTTYFLMAGGTLDLAVTGSMSNMGDGVDSNGAVYITGGTAVVSTYGSFMENGLDTGWGGPVVSGGAVIAGGSSTMAESFSSYSTQCCAVVPTSWMPDGTEVAIIDEDGGVIWSAVLQDGFTCLQISHPDLLPGHVYTLTYGDQSTTLDFTSTTNIESSRGFGGGFPGPW